MQWLFEGSDEAPDVPGLGVLSGRCHRLRGSAAATEVPDDGTRLPAGDRGTGAPGVIKVPHVGWNAIDQIRDASIIEGVPSGSQVYFTHSYVAPVTGDTVATTWHGEIFASVVQRGQIAGVQFHPEKSGEVGLRILRNWLGQAT
jgi:glutamine amidotransferase